MAKKTLGLAGNFMDIEETIYGMEELVKRNFTATPQCIFIAINYLKKFRKIEDIVMGDNFKRIY